MRTGGRQCGWSCRRPLTLWMSRKKEEKINQPFTRADGWSCQRPLALWMSRKKEEEKKPTFCSCGRVVVNADGHVGGCWHYGRQERKKKKPTFYACGQVVINANGCVGGCWRRWTVVVTAIDTMDVKKKEEKKTLTNADGWSSTRIDEWWR